MVYPRWECCWAGTFTLSSTNRLVHLLFSKPTQLVGQLILRAMCAHNAFAYRYCATKLDIPNRRGRSPHLALALSSSSSWSCSCHCCLRTHCFRIFLPCCCACPCCAQPGIRSAATSLSKPIWASREDTGCTTRSGSLPLSLTWLYRPTCLAWILITNRSTASTATNYFFIDISILGALLTLVTFGLGWTALKSNKLMLPIINWAQG